MASNHTAQFGLSQWAATDPVRREDFNEDNRKIEEALAAPPFYGKIRSTITEVAANQVEFDLSDIDLDLYRRIEIDITVPGGGTVTALDDAKFIGFFNEYSNEFMRSYQVLGESSEGVWNIFGEAMVMPFQTGFPPSTTHIILYPSPASTVSDDDGKLGYRAMTGTVQCAYYDKSARSFKVLFRAIGLYVHHLEKLILRKNTTNGMLAQGITCTIYGVRA